jgi:hypothetical protein
MTNQLNPAEMMPGSFGLPIVFVGGADKCKLKSKPVTVEYRARYLVSNSILIQQLFSSRDRSVICDVGGRGKTLKIMT